MFARSLLCHPLHFVRSLTSVLLVGCGVWLAACERTPTTFQELALSHLPALNGTRQAPGLQAPVEVIRDEWGVPHIYAQNMHDMFFAQGYIQAQDRLWQMDIYKRIGEGRLSEILGPEGLRHDKLMRLIQYKRPWDDTEYTSYHPEGRQIVEAFAEGVNAYIQHSPDPLPVEFELTGLQPELWTAQTPLLRMLIAIPVGGARSELQLAQQVAEVGAAEANRRANPTPYRDLVVPRGVDYSIITDEVADALDGLIDEVTPPLVAPYDTWQGATASVAMGAQENSPGSNNWVVSGALTASGKVIVANDPHRAVTNPSLRYVVHLNAPGWSTIGTTEGPLPGVLAGHNGQIAWGWTILGTDQADVYIEEVNPANRNEVRFRGQWEPLRIETETIQVKGAEPVVVELKYSRHGPIFYEDTINHRAYALRSTMQEPGTTGYLGSLRQMVTPDCRTSLAEGMYWKAPSHNLICGDAQGNISWLGAALSPKRAGWHGRLPVPGTGEYEWDGFRQDLPRELNPARGWIATANHDSHPAGYDPPLFFKRAGGFARYERLAELLPQRKGYTVEDFKAMQHDAYLASAAADLPLFRGWTAADPAVESARREVAEWDAVFARDSRAAAIYFRVRGRIPDEARALNGRLAEEEGPGEAIEAQLEAALTEVLAQLRQEQGEDPAGWRWGRINRSELPHPIVAAYDIPAVERRGGAGTVAAIGATWREIVDFNDLAASVASMFPGQSARPGSPFYDHFANSWRNQDEYFPLLWSREAVEAGAQHRLTLQPGG